MPLFQCSKITQSVRFLGALLLFVGMIGIANRLLNKAAFWSPGRDVLIEESETQGRTLTSQVSPADLTSVALDVIVSPTSKPTPEPSPTDSVSIVYIS